MLKLEKRHFGALSGQGLVQTELKDYQKAIDSYKKDGILLIEKLLNNKKLSSDLYDYIYKKFHKSENLIEKSLDKIFSHN